MKAFNKLIIFALTILVINACEQNYIDEVSEVPAGSDETAPTVTINSPMVDDLRLMPFGSKLKVDLEAVDDIELQSVSILLDGSEVKKITEFTDYRRYAPLKNVEIDISEQGLSSHTIQITATDLSGKTTSSDIVPFEVLKYDANIALEPVFYMPFEGHHYDLIGVEQGVPQGTATFTTGVIGQAHTATDATGYVTIPTDNIELETFTCAFWYKYNSAQERSGPISIGYETPMDWDSGWKIFREGYGNNFNWQIFGSWPGGISLAAGDTWYHITFTVSSGALEVFLDGVSVLSADINEMNWDNVVSMSIGSGAPTWEEWDHLGDTGGIDELYFFDRVLTPNEIQFLINLAN